jgi:hypothetical protein
MLLGYLTTPRADMNRPFIFLISTLILMTAIAVVAAQDNGAALNNSTLNTTTSNTTLNLTAPNSTSLNETILSETTLSEAIQKAAGSNDSLNESMNKSIDEAAPGNASRNYAILNTTAANQTALNLSTINNVTLDAVSITEIAKKAPEVAAGASSIQAPTKEEGALLIGKDGWDPLHDRHKSIEPSKIGLPIKPIRDTGKMFFVCDIV